MARVIDRTPINISHKYKRYRFIVSVKHTENEEEIIAKFKSKGDAHLFCKVLSESVWLDSILLDFK